MANLVQLFQTHDLLWFLFDYFFGHLFVPAIASPTISQITTLLLAAFGLYHAAKKDIRTR